MAEITHIEEPENVEGKRYLLIKLDSLHIMEYHALPDGQGPPTEVHLMLVVDGLEDMPMIARFKSPKSLDKLIAALATHRYNVWDDR